MLVGNKLDREEVRSVSTADGKNFAGRENLLFIETSAKDATNVQEAFAQLVTEALEESAKGGYAQLKRPKEKLEIRTGGVTIGEQKSGCC
jgi:hypothetical protein